MDIKHNKQVAKDMVSSKFWLMVGAYILYSMIVGLTSYVIVGFLFVGVLAFGYFNLLLKAVRGEEVAVGTLFCAFDKDFVRTMVAGLLISVFTFLWSLLLIIPGIIKSYAYSMTYFIMADDENIEANDAIAKSQEMMMGHKMELFVQDLSFIGWILLSFFTFGILLFWVIPYMEASRAEFYRTLRGENASDVKVEVVNPSISDEFGFGEF